MKKHSRRRTTKRNEYAWANGIGNSSESDSNQMMLISEKTMAAPSLNGPTLRSERWITWFNAVCSELFLPIDHHLFRNNNLVGWRDFDYWSFFIFGPFTVNDKRLRWHSCLRAPWNRDLSKSEIRPHAFAMDQRRMVAWKVCWDKNGWAHGERVGKKNCVP